MSTFIMFTRLSPETLKDPSSLHQLEQETMMHVRAECPEVQWLHNYAVTGPYDYVDIFEAPDVETATKVSTLVRTYGHAHSEIWPATEWDTYKQMLNSFDPNQPRQQQQHRGHAHVTTS